MHTRERYASMTDDELESVLHVFESGIRRYEEQIRRYKDIVNTFIIPEREKRTNETHSTTA